MNKIELPLSGQCFFAYQNFISGSNNIIFLSSDEENSLKIYQQLAFFLGKDNDNLLHFPSLDTLPYDRVSPNHSILAKRADTLSKISQNHHKSKKLLVTSAANLLIKLPKPEIFRQNSMILHVGNTISIKDLSLFLVRNGFSRSSSAVENGEFASRGEILDIALNNQGYRINFIWDTIESIRIFDLGSQISHTQIEDLELSLASEGLLSETNIVNFKNNFLRIFGVNHSKSLLYESILSGKKFQGYEHLLPLFYEEMVNITDFFDYYQIIYDSLAIPAIIQTELSYNDFYNARISSNKAMPDSFYYAIPPELLINDAKSLEILLKNKNNLLLEQGENNTISSLTRISTSAQLEKKGSFDKLLEIILEHKKKIPVIFCNSKSSIERIKLLINNSSHISNDQNNNNNNYHFHEISVLKEAKNNFINLVICPSFGSFYNDNFLCIAERDITGENITPTSTKSSKKKLQNILLELDNITENELIVHKEHGIGKFEKIEPIKVNNIEHDCLKLVYLDNDILYLPVENINLIKKYGEGDVALDKLGRGNWQKRKAKLKNKIKDIAADLIKITAARYLQKNKPLNFDKEAYDKFCQAFPYSETEDQLNSINDVMENLQSGQLMDRLIIGDVGFGKTEVAMRAAFMVASDIEAEERPQIAVISPTTILSKQHYTSFIERFSGFDFKITHLSRLVKPKEAKKVKESINDGAVNIIIGTHALLSKELKFKNLKLLIIDEEQHFGVAQKEHLKSLKDGVNILSLSATPIPRTLQMSMVGIKELSLIATPPIDRLPIRTNIIPFDPVIIRDALMRERFRGGKSFYVCPRIKDITWVQSKLKEFVPELTYKVAHGQMPASQIDDIMTEFYDSKFDILLSTTIIESGINIQSANTMIIHKADMLGLSQLYQLRGRVGRGKVRGYTYLTLANDKIINKHSLKRLEILQNIDSLGAGFTIASHDMDLRGFGNLVGEEQSGHIKEVGLELYQEMLDEAINDLKNQQSNDSPANLQTDEWSPIINLALPIFIPANYIEDSPLRFAIYRRTGALINSEEIENFQDEMIDRFGQIPKEFTNLLEIVKVKHRAFELKIKNLDSGPNGFVIKFNENFDVSNMVMNFIAKYPRHAKIKPDNKLVFLQTLNESNILKNTYNLLDNLANSTVNSVN